MLAGTYVPGLRKGNAKNETPVRQRAADRPLFPPAKDKGQVAVHKEILSLHCCHLLDFLGIVFEIKPEFQCGNIVVESSPIEPQSRLCMDTRLELNFTPAGGKTRSTYDKVPQELCAVCRRIFYFFHLAGVGRGFHFNVIRPQEAQRKASGQDAINAHSILIAFPANEQLLSESSFQLVEDILLAVDEGITQDHESAAQVITGALFLFLRVFLFIEFNLPYARAVRGLQTAPFVGHSIAVEVQFDAKKAVFFVRGLPFFFQPDHLVYLVALRLLLVSLGRGCSGSAGILGLQNGQAGKHEGKQDKSFHRGLTFMHVNLGKKNRMTSSVIYEGNLRTVATHLQSGSSFETDAPTDNQGKGERFSPTDLVGTSLAACMLTTMAIRARTLEPQIRGVRIDVLKTMAVNPRRISQLDLTFHFPAAADLSESEKKELEQIAWTCPVKESIHPDIQLNVWFNWS